MNRDEIRNEYFTWLCELVCDDDRDDGYSYQKLLRHLHNTEFIYLISKDRNRAEDGMDLRYRFADNFSPDDYHRVMRYLDGPCSVLEMMVALANRCEVDIMDDPNVGNRTGQWFWGMIVNLGLGSMVDVRFDRYYVADTVSVFLNRDYAPNGEGGLFTVNNCEHDLRDVEIWYQMCWYLDSIT